MNELEFYDLCALAKPWYQFNEGRRTYHNWEHAEHVVDNLSILTPHPSTDVILAAYWHDAVYVPGAGSDANERCSAAALAQTGTIYDDLMSQFIIKTACSLIQHTKIEIHLTPSVIVGDLALLLDSDLGSLAAPYDEFYEIQKDIVKEQGGNFADDKEKSAEFIHKFLTCRKHIYHAEAARKMWEKSARHNIARYCNE